MLEHYPKESVEKKEFIGAVGFAEDQGTRETMEDAHVIERNFMGDPKKFYGAVFDGHHGNQAAEFAAQNLHKYLSLALEGGSDPVVAMKGASIITHKKILEEFSGEEYEDAGTAALAVLADGKRVYIAHAGDVRAVLVREDSEERLSEDHKPEDPKEKARIEAAGGKVYQRARLRLPDGSVVETSDWINPQVRKEFSLRGAKVIDKDAVRVYLPGEEGGGISMSRSFGDAWSNGVMSPEPDVRSIEIKPGDLKLIIACDGVWNVITDTMAAEIARGKSAQEAAEAIVKEINSRQKEKGIAQDNVTVLVIDLNGQEGGPA
ncbi:MAG: putative protein phosphatase 2C 22-like [Parcubacteria group bacterium Gr01-1014_19]|nr:MAG: putative protein phosphatase 2C 22-like [Parcubacteria group bacterium Gr01-1014_19]